MTQGSWMRRTFLWPALVMTALGGGCSRQTEEAAEAPRESPATALSQLHYEAPEGWLRETPSSPMRQAQYRLPRIPEDPEDGELVVFYFQGQGGSVQANVDRWVSQFTAEQPPQVEEREINGLRVTLVEIRGTYHTSSGPMMQAGPSKPGFQMLAAVVETPAGPWFFKLTGPQKTVQHWREGFFSLLESIRFG